MVLVTLSWSLFPVLSPQCRGFLSDGQRQSSKLSLIADRHDKSQVVRSIAAVRQRKDDTKLEIGGLSLFSCLSGDSSMTNSLQKWSSGLQLRSAFSKIQENGAGKQWPLNAPSKYRSRNFFLGGGAHAPRAPHELRPWSYSICLMTFLSMRNKKQTSSLNPILPRRFLLHESQGGLFRTL